MTREAGGRTRRGALVGAAGALGVAALAVAALVAGPGRRAGTARAGTARPRAAAANAPPTPSRVAPGGASYALDEGGAAVGFATSRVDTGGGAIVTTDEVVTELPIGGRLNRVTARLRTELTPAVALRRFELAVESPGGPLRVTGRHDGDSLLVLAIAANGMPADTQRVTARGPLVLPTSVPLALARGAPPAVGRRYALAVFDPLALAARTLRFTVRAESLFVVGGRGLRAWRVAPDSGAGFAGWVTADGRVVELAPAGGFTLRRTGDGVAERAWARATAARRRGAPSDRDILESTAIAASAPLRRGLLAQLRVRLGGVELAGLAADGDGQTLRGRTLTVTRDERATLAPGYRLPASGALRRRFAAELAAEPLLQADAPEVRALAARVAGGSRDPVVVAERLTRWLHDSLGKAITIGVPNARQVLVARRGDCNEHTQLYLALARAAGLPARGAAGLARVGRKFYYHAWPEVYLGRWVAVDPTFGEFPADAGHLRLVVGGLGRQAELLRLIGALRIEVLEGR